MSRILVVDDDPGSRVILKSRLTVRGYEVAEADNGARGLATARTHPYDAFLIAAALSSGVDGFEVCRRLKSIPETNSVPLLLFHPQSPPPEDLERGFAAGCDAYLTRAELPMLEHVLRLQIRARRELLALAAELRAHSERSHRTQDERSRGNVPNGADHAHVLRELAAGRPDGILVVDAEGMVRHVDRGACELLGSKIEGRHLASVTPASRLEAFVRDARIEPREGFRFDLAGRRGHAPRAMSATVVPLVAHPGEFDPGLRIVLFYDSHKRKIAAEALSIAGPCIPRQEVGSLLDAARATYGPDGLIGASAIASLVRTAVVHASQSCEPVLIQGEPGVGKERIARTLHYSGSCTGAFLQMRCGAINAENVEAELFGQARNGTRNVDSPGLFHQAQDGTLLLEDVTELPASAQERLLTFLTQGTVKRQDGLKAERIDVRIIASTCEPLDVAVAEGRFAPELAARFEKLTLRIPTLAEHAEDIPLLVEHFFARFGPRREVTEIAPAVLWLAQQYHWPGNIAELEDCIEQGCARATDGVLDVEHLPRALRDLYDDLPEHDMIPARRPSGALAQGTHTVSGAPQHDGVPQASPLARGARARNAWDIGDDDPICLDIYEKKALLRALHHVKGDKLAAARLLQLGKSTLYRKLKRFDIH